MGAGGGCYIKGLCLLSNTVFGLATPHVITEGTSQAASLPLNR
jgi:hypothetical protein